MATKKSKCSQTGDLNLQEGSIFSRFLNDNRRMIMTGLYFIRFSSQNTSVLTTFIVKKYKPEPNRNLKKTNRNRTVSSEPRVTDISVNRGSPTVCTVICLRRVQIKDNTLQKLNISKLTLDSCTTKT